jgi:beta-glucanase (GH16 family)
LRTFYRFIATLLLALSLTAISSQSQALTINKIVNSPKSLSATASSQSILLKWTKATSSTRARITGYQITITSGSWRSVKTASASASSYRVSGLTNSKTYRFILQAISGKYLSSSISILAKPKLTLLSNSIEFMQPSDMFMGAEDQQLLALTNGADAIFESTTPSTCSVTGDKVKALAVGDCIIRATSPAAGRYAAATPVERLLTIAPPPVPLNKVLLWSDEFDSAAGSAPSSANWTADVSDGCGPPYNNCGWGNAEKQYYVTNANVVDGSSDGILNIFAKRQTNATNYNCYYGRCEWTSGKITTYGKVGFTYGYMEARMKLPAGEGSWPAFWMLGTNIASVPWPDCGEIDIMEYKGSAPTVTYGTLHYGKSGVHQMLGGTKDTLVDLSAAYHRYGVLWKPDEVTFFIDDNLVYKARKSDSGMAVWPFGPNAQGKDQDFYLILNLAMGGNFGGAVDSSLDAATLSVDWVRYYSVDGLGKVTNK